MKVVIDTSSLLSLVRYYLPFDKNSVMLNFFKSKIANGEILIIDKVLKECVLNSKGLVVEKIDFLRDKAFLKSAKLPYHTEDLLAPAPEKFLRQVETQFVNAGIIKQRGLTEVEFESQKNDFVNGTDMKLVILCLNLKKHHTEVILVTEETRSSNDNKLFKKIPAICEILCIETITLPDLLIKYDDINVCFK